jgi:transcriptional regulator with XRE-family HTH domain
LSKVSQADLEAFGRAVKRTRTLQGLTLDQAGAKVTPEIGKSLLSKIEKGRKDALSARTVGRLIKAFDLEESWIDTFLDADEGDDDETRAERDADLIITRVQDENLTQGASEDLLIQLANSHAEGNYRDRETAYIAVRNALLAFADMKAKGTLPGNADAQFQAVMARVTDLNRLGQTDDADALLEAEEKRMQAAHRAENDRQTEAERQLLAQRLNQDRLRNRPDLAAKRHDQGPAANTATGRLVLGHRPQSAMNGAIKATNPVISLPCGRHWNWPRRIYERAKAKSGLAAAALRTLGWCLLRLAERSSNDRHLVVAHNCVGGRRRQDLQDESPFGLGCPPKRAWKRARRTMGKRAADPVLLRRAPSTAIARHWTSISRRSPTTKNIAGTISASPCKDSVR